MNNFGGYCRLGWIERHEFTFSISAISQYFLLLNFDNELPWPHKTALLLCYIVLMFDIGLSTCVSL